MVDFFWQKKKKKTPKLVVSNQIFSVIMQDFGLELNVYKRVSRMFKNGF